MRVVAASDWRDGLAFETPFLLADVLPGEPARCFACGSATQPLPRTELWAVKHRHPKNHDGFVRFYCAEHAPATRPAPAATARLAKAERRAAPRQTAPRRMPAQPERPAVLCPDCFVEVPATGVCGICGTAVA